jgi:hypothetical protein
MTSQVHIYCTYSGQIIAVNRTVFIYICRFRQCCGTGTGTGTGTVINCWSAKEKIWANFQRIIELFTKKIVKKLLKIWSWDPGSKIRDPRSGIRKKPIPDPRSGSATLFCRRLTLCIWPKLRDQTSHKTHNKWCHKQRLMNLVFTVGVVV